MAFSPTPKPGTGIRLVILFDGHGHEKQKITCKEDDGKDEAGKEEKERWAEGGRNRKDIRE